MQLNASFKTYGAYQPLPDDTLAPPLHTFVPPTQPDYEFDSPTIINATSTSTKNEKLIMYAPHHTPHAHTSHTTCHTHHHTTTPPHTTHHTPHTTHHTPHATCHTHHHITPHTMPHTTHTTCHTHSHNLCLILCFSCDVEDIESSGELSHEFPHLLRGYISASFYAEVYYHISLLPPFTCPSYIPFH
jgi:hypothetical protein